MWAAIGELLFTVVVGYMGAIELLFVAKQLYHLAFQHQQRQMLLSDDSSLRRLQDQVEREIVEATRKEALGYNAMQDGVLYKDGFRIDPTEISEHEKLQRQVIGGSKTSLEREDRETSEDVAQKSPNESECLEEVVEEPCVKKHMERVTLSQQDVEEAESADDKRTNVTQSIKTQISQTNVEDYAPSIETEKSRLSPTVVGETLRSTSPTFQVPQPLTTTEFSPLSPEMRFDEYQREEPEGQDVPEPPQYSDEYLRSLDGLKIRPLVRDDGSGRRRAFKKRRSSESTSSRESRASREEELKMFTSLEEEEFASIRRGDSDYVPIRYSSDPNLIKSGKHQRRHKKSPIKDSSHLETEASKGSLEMLDEENPSPWGDLKPEQYKDTEFWKREKAISIEEEREENAETWSESIEKEQAGQVTASPSPTKNIPKLSSFEQATPFQHENVVSNLNLEKTQDKPKQSTEKEDVENVSNDADSQAQLLLTTHDEKTSAETEEIVACNKPDDKAEQAGLRRSPRLDDMDHYEEHLREQKNTKMRALSPPAQPTQNNDLSNSQLTEHQPEITPASSIDEQNFSAIPPNIDEISSSLGEETLRGVSPRKSDRTKAPVIEIEPTSDDSNSSSNEPSLDVNIVSESGLLEGISDFYDFNASINPSRSPSVERRSPKSRSPTRCSRETSKERPVQPESSQSTGAESIKMEGLSDFYDFSVMMNQHAYGYQNKRAHEGHRSTTDYLAEKLTEKNARSKSPLPPIMPPKNEDMCLPEESGGTTSLKENPTPVDIPETPEYQRTLSANMRYVESMREEYRQNMYKRSRYVGESMDFDDEFEELREQARHFKRSRSRSRSPIPEEMEASTSKQAALVAARRELQERILDEITRTTINYQDFSRDFNNAYLDFDRRGSDSALIQKPELMIQIDDQCMGRNLYDDDNDDILEGEEYHHFRRFSLGQEHQTEEYPDDDYVYMEQIDVQTKSGIRSWTRKDYRDNEVQQSSETNSEASASAVDNAGEDSDRAEADDVDTESEDDRQTVVEVDDEIDEDVWDFERPEESNDQSECEEAEREMDRYVDKNAKDWCEEGAAGGADITVEEIQNTTDDAINIEEMYDDAIRNKEESKIQKDYDTIVMAMNEEERNKFRSSTDRSDNASVRTDELLDEILREDEERYNRRSTRTDKFEASRKFIEHETNAGSSFQNGVTSTNISSTRLRSRYGIGPSPAHRNFDNIDDVNVDLNYKPKKEYKWRKNFRLDEDNSSQVVNSLEEEEKANLQAVSGDNSKSPEEFGPEDGTQNSNALFPETAEEEESPGGLQESLSLDANFEESENIDTNKKLSNIPPAKTDTTEGKGAVKRITPAKVKKDLTEIVDETKVGAEAQMYEETILPPVESEESEKVSKKKKTKRRSRKGSKGSIGGEELQVEQVVQGDHIRTNNNESQVETGAKKKIKKKKKIAESSSPVSHIKSPSPNTTDPLRATNLNNDVKSESPVTNIQASNIQEPSTIENDSESAAHLAANSTVAKSKSKSPDPTTKSTSSKPQLERNESTGVYDLIKDGSMYPWF